MKAKLFMVVLLLNVAAASAADHDSATTTKNAPTFETLTEGFCYLKPRLLQFGQFEFVQKYYCDGHYGVLFHRDDCRKVDPAFKSICVEAKDNDNIKKVIVVYKSIATEAKRIAKIKKAADYLTVLGYYKGTSRSISIIKPAIDRFVKSTGIDLSSGDNRPRRCNRA